MYCLLVVVSLVMLSVTYRSHKGSPDAVGGVLRYNPCQFPLVVEIIMCTLPSASCSSLGYQRGCSGMPLHALIWCGSITLKNREFPAKRQWGQFSSCLSITGGLRIQIYSRAGSLAYFWWIHLLTWCMQSDTHTQDGSVWVHPLVHVGCSVELCHWLPPPGYCVITKSRHQYIEEERYVSTVLWDNTDRVLSLR